MLPEYVYYSLYQDEFFAYVMEGKTGMKMPRGDKKQIPHFKIKNADISIQKSFVEFVKIAEESKMQLNVNNQELQHKKQDIINRYFV